MKEAPNNPDTNKLNSGISESDIESAIAKSGYPLQTIVANKLREKNFFVYEEWSFLDPNTKETRAIDILASKDLNDSHGEHPRVQPMLSLLIECKQSELPYVFFLSSEKSSTSQYPIVAGLLKNKITISTDDIPDRWTYPIRDALGLVNHRFLYASPKCMTFSKCVRKGKDIVLSGSDGYQNLVLPILSSMHDYVESKKPPIGAKYFQSYLTFGIGVVDSPMIGVTVTPNGHDKELIPWVRVFRHESYEHENSWERKKVYAIDIIHKDFLSDFISTHLLPFASEFAANILRHNTEIHTGEGFAQGMGKDSWDDLNNRLEPKK